MPEIFGRSFAPGELAARTGRIDQVAGARPFVFDDGPARGMRGIEVWTGSGLAFTVLPDRGMDIGSARFGGHSLAWESSVGPVRPERYEPEGLGWLRTFGGGLLTTCGLSHFGGPRQEDDRKWGLHGRASHLAASDVAVDRGWEDGEYRIGLRGRMVEAEVFQPALVLERTIWTTLGSRSLCIEDRLTNAGHAATTAMLLYHVNLGWPLLSETSRFRVRAESVEPRDARAAEGIERHGLMEPPTRGFQEQVYRIRPAADSAGLCLAALVNPDLGDGLGVSLAWPKSSLGHLTQWKMMGEGEYVLGIEPCTVPLADRADLMARGLLPNLSPGESLRTRLVLSVHVGAGELAALEAAVGG